MTCLKSRRCLNQECVTPIITRFAFNMYAHSLGKFVVFVWSRVLRMT